MTDPKQITEEDAIGMLRSAIAERFKSQVEAGQALGLSQVAINQALTGKRRIPFEAQKMLGIRKVRTVQYHYELEDAE